MCRFDFNMYVCVCTCSMLKFVWMSQTAVWSENCVSHQLSPLVPQFMRGGGGGYPWNPIVVSVGNISQNCEQPP